MNDFRYNPTNEALTRMGYFLEWGGVAWERQFKFALREISGTELGGLNVLDIGTRSGRMSCFFALLGASVTGIDIKDGFAENATYEAARWKVSDRCTFIQYDGNLDLFQDKLFDIVFTKSVLLIVQNLDEFANSINRILKSDGKFIFIENSRGGLLHYLRYLGHRRGCCSRAKFFTDKEVTCVKSNLNVLGIKKTIIPPTYLMFGQKKHGAPLPAP